MPIDLSKMERNRIPRDVRGPDILVDPNAAIKEAAANLLARIARLDGPCLGCEGGSYVDQHDMKCAVEALEEAAGAYIAKGSCLACGEAYARITYVAASARQPARCDECAAFARMKSKSLRREAKALIASARRQKDLAGRKRYASLGRLARKAVLELSRREK